MRMRSWLKPQRVVVRVMMVFPIVTVLCPRRLCGIQEKYPFIEREKKPEFLANIGPKHCI